MLPDPDHTRAVCTGWTFGWPITFWPGPIRWLYTRWISIAVI